MTPEEQRAAALLADQQRLATLVRNSSALFLQADDDGQSVFAQYWAKGYNVGGASEITDDVLAPHNMTAGQMGDLINFYDSLHNFLTGVAVTPTNWAQNMIVVTPK